MGLDMYLRKENYIAARYKHRGVKADVSIEIGGKKLTIDASKIYELSEDVAYWRKANAIHKWFVDKIQKGKDDCGKYTVEKVHLIELLNLCKKVKETKDASLLPPAAGFFFGSTDIDEGYWEDIDDTIKQLEPIFESVDQDYYTNYYYQASW